MQHNEIEKIIINNPDSYTMIIKAHHKNFYDDINKNYMGKKFGEKLYRYINKENQNLWKCKNCGNETKFKSFIGGFTEYCCKKCSNIATKSVRSKTMKENNSKNRHLYFETKKCLICNNEFESYKFRKQKCCSAKCSGAYVTSHPNRIKKIKNTKLQKYGNASYVNSEKAKQTCLKKYGVENVFKFRQIKDNIKETNLQKYGVEHLFQSEAIKDKIKETNLQKYGKKNPSESNIVKDKIKKTFLNNFGVENVFKHKPTMEKTYEKNIEKYGAKIPVNGIELKNKMLKKMKTALYQSIIERINKKSECIPMFAIDDYISTDRENKYKFQCKKCNDVFEDHIDGGHLPRCLKCNPLITIGESQAEKEILEYIKTITNDDIVENDRKILNGLELDIYIPNKNIAIEYDGLYWHGEKNGGKYKRYHLNKTKLCNEKGIRLIHIFEDEWVSKKEIVKSKIKHILCENHTNKSLYARKCVIIEIKDSKKFLESNHIQGNCPSAIKLGAYHKGELVAVMTFGKRRVAMGKKKSMNGEYELLRFATNQRVIGIAGKLLNYFIENYNPLKITTYADKRYSIGNLYEKIGFQKIKDTEPNYWYFVDGGNELWHRFNFRKDILSKKLKIYDGALTEWENMKNNGYDRIWDCGNILYEWNK